jgi:hypothetical protein
MLLGELQPLAKSTGCRSVWSGTAPSGWSSSVSRSAGSTCNSAATPSSGRPSKATTYQAGSAMTRPDAPFARPTKRDRQRSPRRRGPPAAVWLFGFLEQAAWIISDPEGGQLPACETDVDLPSNDALAEYHPIAASASRSGVPEPPPARWDDLGQRPLCMPGSCCPSPALLLPG